MKPIPPTKEEAAARKAERERIFAKYGVANWQEAPRAALEEYNRSIRNRVAATLKGGKT